MDFAEQYTRLAAERQQAKPEIPSAPDAMTVIAESVEPPSERVSTPASEPEVINAQLTRLKEALTRSEAALRATQDSRAAFFSAMSHELRTPLNAIMGFSEMIKHGVHGPLHHPTYAEYISHIHDAGGELLSKVNDLLTIGSIHAQDFTLHESTFALSDLFAEAIAVHSHAAFSRGMRMTVDAPAGIELEADRCQLLCVLAHFLSNAIHHSEDGKEIRLSARIQPDDGIILSVRDEGEGIAPEQLAAIRDAFANKASYLTIKEGSIGIGLALANTLALAHGGRIMIDSMRRRGTVTSLILPKERIVRGMPETPQRKKSENRQNHPGRVLELI